MTARATKEGGIDLGCSLENLTLSMALRDAQIQSQVEFLEVSAGCDGCDTRKECQLERLEEVDLATESLVNRESHGKLHFPRDFR